MYVVAVAPLQKGISKESLHYFSAREVSRGGLVNVPLRGKITQGIVLECAPLETQKSALRQAGAPLKKISKILAHTYLDPLLIETFQDTASYHACSLPAALAALLPTEYVASAKPFPPLALHKSESKSEVLAVQENDVERYAYYKRLVREAFARNHSLTLIVPTIADTRLAVRELSRGIGEHVVTLHSQLSQKEFAANAHRVLTETQPILLIATASGLLFMRGDTATVIIDRENSPSYKIFARPFIDVRFFANAICRKTKVRLILGDILLRTETLQKIDEGTVIPAATIKYRLTTKARSEIVDMRAEEKLALSKKEKGRAVGTALTAALREQFSRTGRAILLSARKGLAPTTVCADCGETIRCRRCATPLVLHKTHNEYVYSCHHCGYSELPPDGCPSCGSWKLNLLGIGIEKAEQELSQLFPKAPLFRIDADLTRGKRTIAHIIDEFYATPGSILLCTELALPYLTDAVELTAVLSVDSLLVIPDFRINSRLMNLLVRLRGLASERFIIETRDAGHPLFTHAVSGALIEFFRSDVTERKRFNYPPFSVPIKISRTGRRDVVLDEMEELSLTLKARSPELYASYESAQRGLVTMHLLLSLKRELWPDADLVAFLRSLPPDFTIDIDPVNIL